MKQILIVSDGEPSEVICAALEERGFTVTSSNAETAHTKLRQSPFDIVVVDLHRARDGAEFVRRVRRNAKLCKTSVLTLAEWGTGQPTLALSLGADAYEPKPVDAARLVAAVERLVHRERVRTASAVEALPK